MDSFNVRSSVVYTLAACMFTVGVSLVIFSAAPHFFSSFFGNSTRDHPSPVQTAGRNVAAAGIPYPFGGRVTRLERCHTPPNAYLITVDRPRDGQYIIFSPLGTRCYAFGCPELDAWVLGSASAYSMCDTDLGSGVKNVYAKIVERRPGVGSSSIGKSSAKKAKSFPGGQCKDGKIPFKPGVGTDLKPDIKKSLEDFCSVAGSLDWHVTEGCPNTVSHANPCHAACTCVDIGFQGREYTPEKVSATLAAGRENGASLVFETNDRALYQSLIDSGLSPTQVRYYPQVTGSHFSYYCPTCQP